MARRMSPFAPATCDHDRAEPTAPAVASAAVLRNERRVTRSTGNETISTISDRSCECKFIRIAIGDGGPGGDRERRLAIIADCGGNHRTSWDGMGALRFFAAGSGVRV